MAPMWVLWALPVSSTSKNPAPSGRFAVHPPPGARGPHRTGADPDGADVGIVGLAGVVHIEEHRRRRHGEVAAPSREFAKTPAPLGRPRRQADFGDDLVRRR